MWCTSRASPVSTTRPTLVRLRSRTRWWCTAATASSDGIGASSLVGLAVGQDDDRARRRRWPPTPRRGSRPARPRRPAPPSATGYRQRITLDRNAVPATVDLAVGVEVDQLGQFVVAQHRLRQDDLATGVLVRVEQVAAPGRWCPAGWSPPLRGWRPAAGWSPGRTTAGSSRTASAAAGRAPRPGCRCPSSRSARRRFGPSARPAG